MDGNHETNLKPPATYTEMLDKFKDRGLIIQDEIKAVGILKRINYYRLTGYLLPYKLDENQYREGTTFENIVDLYHFDMRLRSLLLDIFEYVEISMRSLISYHLAHKYGVECYNEPVNFSFRKSIDYDKFISKLYEELDRSKEIFVSHHKHNYRQRYPIWVAVEVLSFSSLSILYTNMKPEDKRVICKQFGLKTNKLMDSWLHSLCILRNRCAHFSRIYDTKLTHQVALTFDAQKLKIKPNTLFGAIFTLKYLVQDQTTWSSWITELNSLLDHYNHVCELYRIGFPEDWENYLRSIPTDTSYT
ncbi:Abi family protein [Xylanibacillus composti]|uniref:Abortive infection bacteriophage resistance protein n=1 Tax=Xylanibacillus composti TaxID=1572762 RepID=A0A8J4H6Y5_9BACL|nr:Abi family protein [Xylanibacillus composti]MDT9726608.1 Abi family protein [Xylanibacillus composti]GIQ70831.1 hypothetical protein XYCOK13_36550 [Xylanibacillus composti]